MTSESDTVDEVLIALADPTRKQILGILAARGGDTVTAIAAYLPVSRQAVAKHMSVLGRAGLIEGHRSGREVLYRVRPDGLDETTRWMMDLASEWRRRLSVIKRLAEADLGEPKTDD